MKRFYTPALVILFIGILLQLFYTEGNTKNISYLVSSITQLEERTSEPIKKAITETPKELVELQSQAVLAPDVELKEITNGVNSFNENNINSNSPPTASLVTGMMGCNVDFSNINVGLNAYSACGDAAPISFSADIGTLTDIEATITLPGEFAFAGNLVGGTLVSTSPLVIQPTVTGTLIDFSIDIQAQCNASDDGVVNFGFTYTGGAGACDEMSLPIPVDDISVLVASPGTPGRNTEDQLIAVLNETDTLTTTIVQEGVGFVDSLFYYVDDHPLMTLDDVIDCNTGNSLTLVTSIAGRNYFWVGLNETGSDGFQRNEGIDICQIWTVTSCPSGVPPTIDYGVATSCTLDPNDLCIDDMTSTPIDFLVRTPRIAQYIDTSIPYDPTCTDAPIRQGWYLVNTGDAPAGDIVVRLTEFSSQTPIDVTSFTYKIGAGGTSQPIPASDITNRVDGTSSCVNSGYSNSGDLYTRMDINFMNIDLPTGESLYFEYDVYPIPCNCNSCDVPGRLGTDISNVFVNTLCDDQVQTGVTRGGVAWPYFDVDIASFDETPVTTCAGQVASFEVTISDYTNTFLNNQGYTSTDDGERNDVYFTPTSGGCTDCYLEVEFQLPNGLDWVGSGPNDFTWSDNDGTLWVPDMATYTDNNGGVDILTVRWTGQEPSGFDAFAEFSSMTFDYTPDCTNELAQGASCSPVLYNDFITKTFRWSNGNCASCPVETLECAENINVVIKCPGMMDGCTDCDGFIQTYANAQRVNLYDSDPDNDGDPDAGSAYNTNILRTDRFLKGDSIEVNMGGYVAANGSTFSNFDYLYAIVDFPNAEFLPIGGEVTIYESGGGTYTCDVLTQSIEPGNLLVTDLSVGRLMANNCTAPTTYENLDSVALTFYYKATEEYMGDIQQLTYSTRFFASDQPYGGAQYSCRLPFEYRLSQVGTQTNFTHVNGLGSFGGCDTRTGYYNGYSRIGGSSLDYFPGEYIGNVETITQFQTNIPTGLVFNYFRVYIRRKNAGTSAGNVGSSIPGIDPQLNGSFLYASHPAITIIGNQLTLDVPTLLQQETGSTDFPFSDEGYSWRFQPYFIGTCALEAGPLDDVNIKTTHETNAELFCSSGYMDNGSITNVNYTGGATIEVAAITSCIEVDQHPTCARIQVSNTGNSTANNVWVTFNSPSGNAVFQSLTDVTGGGSTPLNPTAFNMFQVGNLGAGQNRVYELCMSVNTCELDSLQVYSGYDCLSYPSILEEAVCSSSDFVFYKPVTGALSMISKGPGSDVFIPLCDTVDYVLDLNASGPGYLHDLFVDLNLPINTSYVPGSFEIAYPTTATASSIPPDSEFAPAADPINLYGNSFRFDISGNDPILSTTGLIGSAGSAFNTNVVNVRFKVAVECGFGSGSRIFYEANASEGCGNPLTPIQKDFSTLHQINGVSPGFDSDITLIPSDTIMGCGADELTINVDYSITGANNTMAGDSIRIVLPGGLKYMPGTYNQGTNPSPNEPTVLTESGQEVLYWDIAGLSPGMPISFAFNIIAEDVAQECKDYQILAQTFRAQQSPCVSSGASCSVRAISDEDIQNLFIKKPELVITNASATAMAAAPNEMLMFTVEIENQGDIETTVGDSITVSLYADMDNDGRVTAADTYLGGVNFDASLTPGESTTLEGSTTIPAGNSCTLLAYIDPKNNCVCNTSTSTLINADLDLKLQEEFTVCSNEAVEIGPTSGNYTYEWISIGGSDLTALSPNTSTSPVTFQYDNNTGSTVVWDYGIRVGRGTGCYSFDTITVTIHPESDKSIETQVCGPVPNCGTAGAGFSLVGPLGGTSYLWSIENGDNNAAILDFNDPLTGVPSGVSETTTFLLDYNDSNGCPTEFRQTVSVLNCACTALGDTVWYDLDVDGMQDLNEPGIPDLTVFLYNANDLSTPIQATMTNAVGYYAFVPLPAGNYVVRFDTLGNTAPYHLLVPTIQDAGSNDEDDSDADPTTGFTGSYYIPNGEANWTVDAGFYPAFDLALKKELDTMATPGPYFPGDNIQYNITIYNQGGYYPATNVEITDYIPTGLSYVSGTSGNVTSMGGATINVSNSGTGVFTLDNLPILDEVKIQLTLQIDAGFTGSLLTNYAEISDFSNQYNLPDVDSNADSDNTNDAGGSPNSPADNYTDGTGMGMTGDGVNTTDEDDHDPAQISILPVDLALMKKIDNSFNAEPIAVGELLKFDIIVINQGQVSVNGVDVIDHVPAGLSFDPAQPLNVVNGWSAGVTTTVPGILNPGERDTVSIYLTALQSSNPADYINTSEITAAYDTTNGRDIAPFDIDSNPNSNTAAENGTVPGSTGDNNISSTGIGGPGSEDDHDVEAVDVVYPDVALIKVIDPSYDLSQLNYGDSIKFLISAINQGTMDAANLKVMEYLPKGLSFDNSIPGNSIWIEMNDSTLYTNVPNVIANSQKQVCIWLRLEKATNMEDWTNVAEISEFIDKKGINRSNEDPDSQLDSDESNNGGGAAGSAADNEVNGNGTGAVGDGVAATDEDNSDPATVNIYDLALKKTIVTAAPYDYGDTIRYAIKVFNQGNVPTTNIEITDSIPPGLTFISTNNPSWTGTAPEVSTTITSTLGANDSITVFIDLVLTQTSGGLNHYTNIAEISGSEDTQGNDITNLDIDSSPDTNTNNDAGGQPNTPTDNQIDGNGTDDEDDHDPAYIEIFDLALTKKLSSGQMTPTTLDSIVTYDIEVCNQGNIDAFNILVVDYIPAEMELADNTWSAGVGNEVFKSFPSSISVNSCAMLSITLKVTSIPASGMIINYSEISSAEDSKGNNPDDIDSPLDNDPINDGPVTDDSTDNSNGDEDDHDPANITVIDVMCIAGNSGPVCPNTMVTLSEAGTGNVAWSWTGPSGFTSNMQNPVVNPVVPGTYMVTVTDGNGFQKTCSTEVTLHPAMTITGNPINTSCNGGADGQIMLTVNGGLAPFTFDWDNNGLQSPDTDPQNLIGLSAGNYEVFVTDANGCLDSMNFTITEPTVVSCTTTSTNVNCNGSSTGAITIMGNGGTPPYQYSINTGPFQPGNVFTGLAAGNYTVTTRDANNCTSTCMATITEPTALSCSLINTSASGCGTNDGTIMASATGGVGPYEYSLDGATFQTSGNFINLMPGDHIVAVRDANDCISYCSTVITAPGVPTCQITSVVNVACYGDSTGSLVAIESSGGGGVYEFSLDSITYHSTGNFTNLPAGLQVIYVRDAGSTTCISMCAINLIQPDSLDCLLTGNNITCGGGADGNITVGVMGGTMPYQYSLNGGSFQPGNIFMGLAAGNHTVLIRDGNNCEKTCSIILTEPTALTCNITKMEAPCNGDGATLTVNGTGGTGTYAYSLSGGIFQSSNMFTNVAVGNHAVTIRDASNCTSTCAILVNEPPVLACNIASTTPESCAFNDGTITVSSTGGTGVVQYSIDTGMTYQASNIFAGLAKGEHLITVRDANGCTSTCTAMVAPDCFDLALRKTLATPGPYAYNQDVQFDIWVYNQGNVDATDVEVTDFVPCGFTYQPFELINLIYNWTPFVTPAPMSTISNLAAGDSVKLSIQLKITECSTPNSYINISEISDAQGPNGENVTDYDSSPDFNPLNDRGGAPNSDADNTVDGDGTGAIGDGTAATDEDDHDPAYVPIFDLALTKMLTTSTPYNYGDTLTFQIQLCNQSSNPATNIVINDYIPSGYGFDVTLNAGWSGAAMGPDTLNYTYTNVLLGNTCDNVTLLLTLEQAFGINEWENIAEIGSFADTLGNTQTDVDSTPDDDPTNDAGGELNGPTDNQTNGNGTDDEDDHDPAGPRIFDLALKKVTSQTGPFRYGDTVTFDLRVFNQGNVTSTNIEINDEVPCGFHFDAALNPLWMQSGNTVTSTMTNIYILEGGDSLSAPLHLIVEPCNSTMGWRNTAEISKSEDNMGNDTTNDDIDSQADGDPSNDGMKEDNVTDNTNGDEDDSDLEIIEVFDLAQIKQLVTAAPHEYGDTLTYNIIVLNQGNVPATNIEVTDHLPIGLAYDASLNTGWTATLPMVTNTITDTLHMGEADTVNLQLVFNQTMGGLENYTNISEISSAEDNMGNNRDGGDADSTPDNMPNNDTGGEPGGLTDDQTDGNGMNDEDDHDPAYLEVFDLALKKTTQATGPFSYGDTITFDITVYNQGNVPATNIHVMDHTPCGYQFDLSLNPAWTMTGSGMTASIITDTLAGGDTINVPVTFTIWACSTPGAWQNTAEISYTEDNEGNDRTNDDVDSQADEDPDNDGMMENDDVVNTNGDEDDSDYEVIHIFDIAQIKQLVTPAPHQYGDTLTYAISVFGQGNISATNIVITDHIPDGLMYDASLNPTWTGAAPAVNTTITDTVNIGDTVVVYIDLVLMETMGGMDEYTNISEVLMTQDTLGNITTGDDIDSKPNNNPNDDNGGVAGSPTDNQIDDHGMVDEDDHDPAIVKIYDLALKKTTAQTGPFSYGDTITFDFTVYNQGNMPTTNIIVAEHMPCGYGTGGNMLDSIWTIFNDSVAITVIQDTLHGGDSAIVSIDFIVEPCGQLGAWYNVGEISSFQDIHGNDKTNDDRDSQGDMYPDNDGMMEDNVTNNMNGDEDDSDFEIIYIYDLAQIKQVVTPGPYSYGDTITYAITVYGQGNIPATNVVVTDHIPTGLTYDTSLNSAWSGTAPSVSTTITDTLNSGDSAVVNISLVLTQSTGGAANYTNIAEITMAQDTMGNNTTGDDVDSTPDTNPNNDNGGIPNDDTDDQTDGNGMDDEDDHDPAIIDVFDLALTKTATATGPFSYGDTVTFNLEVTNQGNIASTNIEITEYVPCGYHFEAGLNTGWTMVNDSIYTSLIIDTLVGGANKIVPINLILQPCAQQGAWINGSEISAAQDTTGMDIDDDIDSTPDDDPDNDDEMEDDSDTEVIDIFDLAQIKRLTTMGPYEYNDTLNFEVVVVNQGNTPATNINIIDNLPVAYTYAPSLNTGWVVNTPTSYTYLITDTLAKGDTVRIPFNVLLTMTSGSADAFTNYSEISAATDTMGVAGNDADSTPDNDSDNDGVSTNNAFDDPNDEDDHDYETLGVVDLALAKTTSQTGPFKYGDTITFDIAVYNQSNIPSKNIEITEYISCGYSFEASLNPNWTLGGSGMATAIITDTLQGGDIAMVPIQLVIQPCNMPGAWNNMAEISASQDINGMDNSGDDIDSTPDNNPDNDGMMEDNVINNMNGDEDDSDFEIIYIYDLAQIKQVVTPGPYSYGDTITYAITVYGQGNIPATNVVVTDHIPTGLTYDASLNSAWSGMTPSVSTTITDTLNNGDSAVVNISLVLTQSTGGAANYTNIAEITMAQDTMGNNTTGDDVDSTPDADPNNDNGGNPNNGTDDQTDNTNGDEDDHDPATIDVFDLALTKTTMATVPFNYGDTVTFNLEVTNQGNIASTNIEITEYVPCGYRFEAGLNTGWTMVNDSIYTSLITDTLVGGATKIVPINLIIQECATMGAWSNVAEISATQDTTGKDTTNDDIDSQADDDPDNDGDMEDDATDNTNGDEDDSDSETLDIVDLALVKHLLTPYPYELNDTVAYEIKVVNQGAISLKNIVITDHLPAAFSFDASLNTGWNSGTAPIYTYTIQDTLNMRDTATVTIYTILTSISGATEDFVNYSEILSLQDQDGNDRTGDDADSTPDNNPDNDGTPVDDSYDNPSDEDDHDLENLAIFDLALKKQIAETGPFAYGDTLTFDFTIYNQGTINSTNIEVTDVLPCGFEFDANLNPNWTATSPTNLITTITDTIVGTDSAIVSLALIIEPCNQPGGWKNAAEISGSEDTNGNDRTDSDVDSQADDDPTNDGMMVDDATDNTNGDEDDSDFELVEVFDLALTKNLAAAQPSPIRLGDNIKYEIELYNQGNLTAYDIDLMDYIPNGLLFDLANNTALATGNPNNWTLSSGIPSYVVDSLLSGDSTAIILNFTLSPAFRGTEIVNIAEIAHAAKEVNGISVPDIDSFADSNSNNDNGGEPNGVTDGQTNGNGITDEDDHDPALIEVVFFYARIADPCTCLANGLLEDEIVIFSNTPNAIFELVENTGMFTGSTPDNLIAIPLGTQPRFVGIEDGLYKYSLPLIHQDGIGYTAKFSNGTPLDDLVISNLCNCPGTPIGTNPDGTPPPVGPPTGILFNPSKTPAETELKTCEGTNLMSSFAEHKQYVDTTACKFVHTFCPQNQWQQLKLTISEFDLAAGDTLCVFEGKDTLGMPVQRWSGTGVSQTDGWISASCDPIINTSGCLTFLFKTNGDNSKGTGFMGNFTCNERDIVLNATPISDKLECGGQVYSILDIKPATIMTDCGAILDTQFIRIYDGNGKICLDTCLGGNEMVRDTFGIGNYKVEYKLKGDTVKATETILSVQAPSLVCNDKVVIPLGSACEVALTPDDLLENPCDTITDTMYYYITIKGIGKDGKEQVLAAGGGKGGNYPMVMKDMIKTCGGPVTATIERRYYKGLNLTFCNNGEQAQECSIEVDVKDQSAPIFWATANDTLINCNVDLTQKGLGLKTPVVYDNCSEVTVEMVSATRLNQGAMPCDTARLEVLWKATDECGNTANFTQAIVVIRPSLDNIVKTEKVTLACNGDTDAANVTVSPGFQIGKWKNGTLDVSDTLYLSTEEYVCGYILKKRDVELPANDCGKKVYREWSIVDWCASNSDIRPIDTTFIEYLDTLAPKFVANIDTSIVIELDHNACVYDATKATKPTATDNCSVPTVRLAKVSRIEDGEEWEIPVANWAMLDCDSFKLQWVAADNCHEQLTNDTVNQIVEIKDVSEPSVVCKDQIHLSLGQDKATLHYSAFDGGSYDACGIKLYEVSRDEEKWDSIVTFSCEDVHKDIKVYLRVTDNKGNQATCWMVVNPEDKIAPICVDLPDVKGTCDDYHNGELGATTDHNENGKLDDAWTDMTEAQIALYNAKFGNPNCSDNLTCEELTVQQQYQLVEKNCGIKHIKRRYRAVDWFKEGNVSGWAEQNIEIKYQADWAITLPVDWKGECGEGVPTSEVVIKNGQCDLMGYEVEEKTFTVIEDACLKIVRTFTIINWCTYEVGQETHTIARVENEHGRVTEPLVITSEGLEKIGKLEYIQILKLQDETAPTITLAEVDTCINEPGCFATKEFSITATDCNDKSNELLVYNWTMSVGGTEIASGTGNKFEALVEPKVKYSVVWKVQDNCGNIAWKEENYEFWDCKKPSPYCIHGIAVELMQDVGTVQVWATDVERNSSDNCTAANKLEFRIWHTSLGTPPTNIEGVQALPKVITFDCNTIGTQSVNLYAIDEEGNWDFCTTQVVVQDNMGACNDIGTPGEMAIVSGTIMDWKQKTVESVMVDAKKASQSMNNYMTKEDGHYGFELEMYNNYTIQPERDDQPLNGVSTFDLVLISKHILGMTSFDNPYQMIAADVNGSGTITAFDMVQIRQLILNISTDFANSPSWKFVYADYAFTTDNPAGETYPQMAEIIDLRQNMTMDFVAVKMGDVNGNAISNSLVQAESRTTPIALEIQTQDRALKAGETYHLAFSTNQLEEIQGYQFTLIYEDLKVEKLHSGLAGIENFGLHKLDDGFITTSWNQTSASREGVVENEGAKKAQPTTLFTIEFTALKNGQLSDLLSIQSTPTVAEAYDNAGNLMKVQLTYSAAIDKKELTLYQNQPNPFEERTSIGFYLPGDDEISLLLMDEVGRILKVIKEDRKAGYNVIEVEKGQLPSGFIYYQLSTKYGIKTKKMLKIY